MPKPQTRREGETLWGNLRDPTLRAPFAPSPLPTHPFWAICVPGLASTRLLAVLGVVVVVVGGCWCCCLVLCVVVVVAPDHRTLDPPSAGPPSAGPPEIRFFSPSPSLNFGGVFESWDPKNVHILGLQRFKQHQKSTRRPPERRGKERKWKWEKKKREILGPPPHGAAPFGAPPFNAPKRLKHQIWPKLAWPRPYCRKRREFIAALQFGSQVYSYASSSENSSSKSSSGQGMGKLEKISAWNLTKVKSKKEVIDEARTKGAKVHFCIINGHMASEKC